MKLKISKRAVAFFTAITILGGGAAANIVIKNRKNASKVETKDENYKQGVDLVLKQFKDVLASKGVQEIKQSFPILKSPTFIGLNPSTSFSGLILLHALF